MVENQLRGVLQPQRLESERDWSDAPPELLSLILSQLYLRDRCNFKRVCKSWNLIVPIPPPLPPALNSPYSNSPCLMFSPTSRSSSWKLFHSLYNEFYDLDFPELIGAEIHYSKDGWLLVSRDKCPLFFFNPSTKAKFELPPTSSSFMSVCFTKPPTSSDCSVFGIFSTSYVFEIEFGLIRFGDHEWKSGWLDNGTNQFQPSTFPPPLFLNGVYYCLEFKSKNIRIFDPTKEDESQWIHFDTCKEEEDEKEEEEEEEEDTCKEEEEEEEEEEEKEDDTCEEEEEEEDVIHESYMIEVEGEIWGVFVTNDDRKVSVEKLDLVGMRWSKLKNLNDKCLYVSNYGSSAETCATTDLANKIYLDKFCDKNGVIYSLSSGMYHSVVGNFASEEDFGLNQVDHGAWIKFC